MSSPTGNIWCYLDGFVECTIQEDDHPRAVPQDCGGVGDWTDNLFAITQSAGARGGCRSDTPFSDGRPPGLEYGTTALTPGHACQSQTTGMTCWDRKTGHGFRLSRASYDLF